MIKLLRLIPKLFFKSFKLSFFIFKKVISFLPSLIYKVFRNIGKRLRFSITFKITVIYALIFSIFIFLLSAGILFGFRYFLLDQVSSNIEKNNQIISTYIKEKSELPKNIINEIANLDDMYVTVFNTNKEILHSTDGENVSTEFYNKVGFLDIIDRPPSTLMILNSMLDHNEIYYVQISKDLATENFYLASLTNILIIVNLVSLFIITMISSKASKKMLSPIAEMTETVKTISVEALDTRLNVGGSKDELKELAETFNTMIDGIEQAYEQQNQFVSDASHELRTPISVIQGYANLLDRWGKDDRIVLDESITAIKSESESMKNLIENLLFLARGDKKLQKLQKEKFYINELIEDIVKETKMIDIKHNILCESNDRLLIFADKKMLKEALRTFIDNSVKFTPENGTIKINSYNRKSYLEILIEDTGIGIDKDDLPHVFNRFYRADKSRTKNSGGNGLGLSIAKWIIDRHSGKITLWSQLQKGTKVSIFLPIS
jgi:signal transduction histidine kinase